MAQVATGPSTEMQILSGGATPIRQRRGYAMSDLKKLRARAKKVGWVLQIVYHSSAKNGTQYWICPKTKPRIGVAETLYGGPTLKNVEQAIELIETTGYI